MTNTIGKYIITTFSTVSNPYPCYPYKFITENCSSKITIMPFWAPAQESPAKNGIPEKPLARHCYIIIIIVIITVVTIFGGSATGRITKPLSL